MQPRVELHDFLFDVFKHQVALQAICITRGYSVDVGMVEIKKQDKDGKWVRIQLEVDFIASLD